MIPASVVESSTSFHDRWHDDVSIRMDRVSELLEK